MGGAGWGRMGGGGGVRCGRFPRELILGGGPGDGDGGGIGVGGWAGSGGGPPRAWRRHGAGCLVPGRPPSLGPRGHTGFILGPSIFMVIYIKRRSLSTYEKRIEKKSIFIKRRVYIYI
jgi:hypothetical protein